MSEKLGVENLVKIIEAVGEGINVVHRIIKGGGIFHAFALTDELSALGGIKKDVLLAEMKDLDAEDRMTLVQAFKEKISIEDKVLEQKLEGGADVLDEAVIVVYDVLEVVEKAKFVFARAKALLG